MINITTTIHDLAQSLSKEYDIFNSIDSIIVCGNGSTGYSEDSGKFIDSHSLVVRMNNYVTINNITGEKTDVLFAGASSYSHLEKNQYYPEINKFKTIISTPVVIRNINNVKQINHNPKILFYDKDLIVKITRILGYTSHMGISGIHCCLLFLAIAKKNNAKINFLGFDIGSKNTNKEIYYYGERPISITHHQHDWDFHSKFFEMIYDRYASK